MLKYKFICFSGLDGSGKTSQAFALIKRFKENDIKCKYIWIGWSPTLLKPVSKIIKRILMFSKGIRENDYEEFTQLKRDVFNAQWKQVLWMSYVFMDYYFQVFWKICIPLKFGFVVVCDRYIYDVLIDFAINYSWSTDTFIKRIKKMPVGRFTQPDVLFFIDTDEITAFKRKNDIPSLTYLTDRRKYYLALASTYQMETINGNQPLDAIHSKIMLKLG